LRERRESACCTKPSLVRSVTHNLGAHPLAGHLLSTGNRPLPSLQYPTYGAVLSKERPAEKDVPPHVAIPDGGAAGYLGVAYSAYGVGGIPTRRTSACAACRCRTASRWSA
jgi:hypothetical protein